MASLCNPHVWDYQNWLPLIVDTAPAWDYQNWLPLIVDTAPADLFAPADYPAMTCQNCGRVLAIKDTSPNQRGSIASSIASRLYEGDEYSEVFGAVMDYFNQHLTIQRA